MTPLIIIQFVLIALLGVLVVGLLRSHAEILRRLHDLGVSLDPADGPSIRTVAGVPEPRSGESRAFDIVGESPRGGTVTVSVLGMEHLTLLAFLSTGCMTCRAFWEEFSSGPPADLPGGAGRLVIVTKGLESESESAIRALSPQDVPTVLSSQAWEQYNIPVAPYFVLVEGATGRIVGEGAAATWTQVSSLLGQALSDQHASARRRRSGARRHADTDAALLAAGIKPGDASLYPTTPPDVDD